MMWLFFEDEEAGSFALNLSSAQIMASGPTLMVLYLDTYFEWTYYHADAAKQMFNKIKEAIKSGASFVDLNESNIPWLSYEAVDAEPLPVKVVEVDEEDE